MRRSSLPDDDETSMTVETETNGTAPVNATEVVLVQAAAVERRLQRVLREVSRIEREAAELPALAVNRTRNFTRISNSTEVAVAAGGADGSVGVKVARSIPDGVAANSTAMSTDGQGHSEGSVTVNTENRTAAAEESRGEFVRVHAELQSVQRASADQKSGSLQREVAWTDFRKQLLDELDRLKASSGAGGADAKKTDKKGRKKGKSKKPRPDKKTKKKSS